MEVSPARPDPQERWNGVPERDLEDGRPASASAPRPAPGGAYLVPRKDPPFLEASSALRAWASRSDSGSRPGPTASEGSTRSQHFRFLLPRAGACVSGCWKDSIRQSVGSSGRREGPARAAGGCRWGYYGPCQPPGALRLTVSALDATDPSLFRGAGWDF